jgi:hypothetical protein
MTTAFAIGLLGLAWAAVVAYLIVVIAERRRQDRKKDSDQ